MFPIDPSNIMITAVGYALPMQIIIGLRLGIGIGTTVLVARKLGGKQAGKRQTSRKRD